MMIAVASRFRGALLLLALAGCGDLLDPSSGLSLGVQASNPAMQVTFGPDNWPQAFCDLRFTATASGEGEATWGDVRLRWFIGLDRSTAVDSQLYSAAEMVAAWGSETIAPGQAQSIDWEIWADYPFEVEAEFRFRSGGEDRATTTRAACGPKPHASLPPPLVSSVTLASPAASYQPGDTVGVRYQVGSGAATLWATIVAFQGAFEESSINAGRLATNQTDTVFQRVPSASLLGTLAQVSVLSVDAFGRAATATRDIGPVSDETTPTVVAWARGRVVDAHSAVLTGRFFVGDTLEVRAVASDNHRLAAILWEGPGVPRDSVQALDSAVTATIRIGFRQEWGNDFALRVTARDVAGRTAESVVSRNQLSVYPSFRRPVASVSLTGGYIHALANDPGREVAYALVTDRMSTSYVAVVSVPEMTLARTIPLGNVVATTMGLSASRDTLFVALPGKNSVAVINLASGASPTSVRFAPFESEQWQPHPFSVAATTNGRLFLIPSRMSQPFGEVNLATQQQRLRLDASAADSLMSIARSLDGTSLTIVRSRCAQRYDTAADTFSACTPLERSGASASDLTGERHLVGLDVYDRSFSFLRTVESVPTTLGTISPGVMTPGGDYVHHFRGFAGFVRSRVSDGALVDRTVGAPWPEYLAMWPDGSRVLISSFENIAVSRLTSVDLRPESATAMGPATARGAVIADGMRSKGPTQQLQSARPLRRGGMRVR